MDAKPQKSLRCEKRCSKVGRVSAREHIAKRPLKVMLSRALLCMRFPFSLPCTAPCTMNALCLKAPGFRGFGVRNNRIPLWFFDVVSPNIGQDLGNVILSCALWRMRFSSSLPCTAPRISLYVLAPRALTLLTLEHYFAARWLLRFGVHATFEKLCLRGPGPEHSQFLKPQSVGLAIASAPTIEKQGERPSME